MQIYKPRALRDTQMAPAGFKCQSSSAFTSYWATVPFHSISWTTMETPHGSESTDIVCHLALGTEDHQRETQAVPSYPGP